MVFDANESMYSHLRGLIVDLKDSFLWCSGCGDGRYRYDTILSLGEEGALTSEPKQNREESNQLICSTVQSLQHCRF